MNSPEIIIIDDSEMDHFVATEVLKMNLDVDVVTCVSSAANGLDLIENRSTNSPKPAAVILLDIKMPVIDGFGFLDRFDKFSEEIKSGYKIFMLSSSLDPRDIARAEESKYVHEFLEKPVNDKVILKLQHLFEN